MVNRRTFQQMVGLTLVVLLVTACNVTQHAKPMLTLTLVASSPGGPIVASEPPGTLLPTNTSRPTNTPEPTDTPPPPIETPETFTVRVEQKLEGRWLAAGYVEDWMETHRIAPRQTAEIGALVDGPSIPCQVARFGWLEIWMAEEMGIRRTSR